MARAQLDPSYRKNHKVKQLSPAAVALDIAGICYANEYHTDGQIPADALPVLMPKVKNVRKAAAELVAVGRWHADDDGWWIHDFAEFNVTSDKRQATTNRKRRSRGTSQSASRVTDDVTPGVTDTGQDGDTPHPLAPSPPHPPNPTPPAPAKKRARETPLPADWQPTAEHRQRATQLGLDCDAEARKFRANAESRDRRLVRWNAGFTQWLEHAPEFKGRGSNVQPLRANDSFADLDRNDPSAWSRNGGAA